MKIYWGYLSTYTKKLLTDLHPEWWNRPEEAGWKDVATVDAYIEV